MWKIFLHLEVEMYPPSPFLLPTTSHFQELKRNSVCNILLHFILQLLT